MKQKKYSFKWHCAGALPAITMDPLKGCDGQPHSTEFLIHLLDKATKDEDYEMCVIYRDELKRRSSG